jgi:hypothetical protein
LLSRTPLQAPDFELTSTSLALLLLSRDDVAADERLGDRADLLGETDLAGRERGQSCKQTRNGERDC